jgi:hypothetical protein
MRKMMEEKTAWNEAEFAGIKLGDERLNVRAIKLLGQLSAQPQAYINQACEDWAASKAAYRFFDNDQVEPAKILAPHYQQTAARMAQHPVILALQDSSELNYRSHLQTTGLGPIGSTQQEQKGLLLHTTLAVTPAGLPLGLLTQQVWARPQQVRQPQSQHKAMALADKESAKWLTALEATQEQIPPGVQVVTVADREADIYEFLLNAEKQQLSYVVRAAQDRRLMIAQQTLWQHLQSCPVVGQLTVEVAEKKKEAARTAIVNVRYREVEVRPPQRLKKLRLEGWKAVRVWAVYVTEEDPPEKVTPLEWMLLTNVDVSDFDSAIERVAWYVCRWLIELYFKILKSGCRVEQCLLASGQRLKRYLALMGVVAWRLFWLTYFQRQNPEASCRSILTEAEWQALYCRVKKTIELPEQEPTVREVVRWIAQLGGFLGRKHDGEPGITVIWRGWQRLQDIAAMWRLLNSPLTYG